jgi:hypothetical protein
MNGSKIRRAVTRIALLGVTGSLAACATAPPAHETSILDELDNQQRAAISPHSCAELHAASLCEKSTRLGGNRNCRCVDAQAIAGARPLRF